MFTSILILVLALIIYSVADAVIDKTMFHYSTSIFKHLNPKYWQVLSPGESWRNKYKGRDPKNGEAFPGSTSFFVFATDGFHLMKQIQILALGAIAAVVVQDLVPIKAWWIFLGSWLLAQVILSAVFHYFFHTVFDTQNQIPKT